MEKIYCPICQKECLKEIYDNCSRRLAKEKADLSRLPQ